MVMSRGVPSGMLAALSGPMHPVMLVYVDWPGGVQRAHSNFGTITWGGHDWTGVGSMGGVTLPGEMTGIASDDGALTLGGLPEVIDDLLSVDPRGSEVLIYFGLTTVRNGTTLVSDPVLAWSGYVDGMASTEGYEGQEVRSTITLPVVSRASQRLRPAAYHSEADQAAEYPGDTAGRWLTAALARTTTALPKW
jgi:hypothetical protein